MSQQQSRSPYKQAQIDLIEYLDREVFAIHLVNPNRLPAHEIFCFSDANAARHPIRGSLRAAIHTALTDPQVYLKVRARIIEFSVNINQKFDHIKSVLVAVRANRIPIWDSHMIFQHGLPSKCQHTKFRWSNALIYLKLTSKVSFN